jgi:hypothetical protein
LFGTPANYLPRAIRRGSKTSSLRSSKKTCGILVFAGSTTKGEANDEVCWDRLLGCSRLLNADTIETVKATKHEAIVTFKNGRDEKVWPNDYEEFRNGLLPIIPAQPGYEFLVCSGEHSDEFWFRRLAIIAWRIGSYIDPVTLDVISESQPQAILDPSGRVTIQAETFLRQPWRAGKIRAGGMGRQQGGADKKRGRGSQAPAPCHYR